MTEAVILIASVAMVALASLQVMGYQLDCRLRTVAVAVYRQEIKISDDEGNNGTATEIGDPCQPAAAIVQP